MRSSTVLLAGASAVSAQLYSSITGGTQTFTITDSNSEPLYTTTVVYSNPATAYQSLTNSEGVVTGLPEGVSGGAIQTDQPAVVTSQPSAATIPAGLPTGVTYIPINGTNGLTSFQVSVGSSTTVVLGGAGAGATTGSGSGAEESGSAGSSDSSTAGSGSSSGSSDASSSDSAASASASQSGNAASSVRVAGAGIGLFAFIAALL